MLKKKLKHIIPSTEPPSPRGLPPSEAFAYQPCWSLKEEIEARDNFNVSNIVSDHADIVREGLCLLFHAGQNCGCDKCAVVRARIAALDALVAEIRSLNEQVVGAVDLLEGAVAERDEALVLVDVYRRNKSENRATVAVAEAELVEWKATVNVLMGERTATEAEVARLAQGVTAQAEEARMLREAAMALYERVQMDESVGICLSERVTTLALGAALAKEDAS